MNVTNNTLLNSGYYTLNQGSTSSTTAASATTVTTATSAASSATNDSLSYMLNLSPEAQNYLSSGLGLGGTSSPIASYSSDSSFTLSKSQQKTLDGIMEKYKGAPYTQETFNLLQKDLEKSGLAPDQLATQSKINAFNPTYSLLDALSGNDSDGLNASIIPSDAQLDTQKGNYVKMIGDQFEKIAAPDTASADDATGTAGGTTGVSA